MAEQDPEKVAPESAEAGDALHVRALSKGLQILSMFMVERPELTLKDIVRETGFPRPTAYRLARTLEDELYIVFNPVTGRYHLGPAMIPALYLLKDPSNLVRLLHSHLQDLAETAEEHASLAVEVDRAAVVIDSVSSSRNLFQPNLPVGRVQEGLATAHRKVFVAFKKSDELAALLAEPQVAHTAHTLTDPKSIAADLATVAREGVAFDIDEYWTGVCAVAAPVRDRSGAVAASLSVVVATERCGEDRRRLLADITKTFAQKMSFELGHSSEGRDSEGVAK